MTLLNQMIFFVEKSHVADLSMHYPNFHEQIATGYNARLMNCEVGKFFLIEYKTLFLHPNDNDERIIFHQET